MYGRLIALIGVLAVGSAQADETMRCGSKLVDASASVAELLKRCGEPASKRVEESDARALGANGYMIKVGTVITEYWTYSRGTQAAPIVVTIVSGKIKTMGRVAP